MPPIERERPRQREAPDEQPVRSGPIERTGEQTRQREDLIITGEQTRQREDLIITGEQTRQREDLIITGEQTRQGQESIFAEESLPGPIERAPTRGDKGELRALHLERDRAAREHIGLPSLAKVARTLHDDAQVRLDKPSLDEADRVVVREALSKLEVLASNQLWAALEAAAHEQDQPGLRDLRVNLVEQLEHDEELRTALREAVAEELDQAGLGGLRDALIGQVQPDQRMLTELLAEATSDQVDSRLRQVIQVGEIAPVVVAVRTDVSSFVDKTRQFVAEPFPSAADEQGQAAWVRRAKALLKEGYALLSNIMVAAAFTLPAVQRAVQHAAHTSAEFADQTLSHLGPAVPSLLAVTTLAAMVGMGMELYKEYRPSASPAERPEAGNEPRPADPGASESSDADIATSRRQASTDSS
jgi:hypothetical protein